MRNTENSNPTLSVEREFEAKKSHFFKDLIIQHLPEMRLLIQGGKLTKNEGWRNVAEHCLIQVAMADTLGDMLGLPEEDKRQLEVVAGCHDWAKRLEKNPDEFSSQDLKIIQDFLEKAKPNPVLMAATGSLAGGKDPTLLEKIQYYIDNITDESEIIDPVVRIERAKSRHPELDNQFFNKEKELSQKIEEEIFRLLVKNGIEINSSKDLPLLIRQKIYERIMSS